MAKKQNVPMTPKTYKIPDGVTPTECIHCTKKVHSLVVDLGKDEFLLLDYPQGTVHWPNCSPGGQKSSAALEYFKTHR
jgi:hypothetical protein